MAAPKRDRWGNWIVEFRTGGRGSKVFRRNLGDVTYAQAKTAAAEYVAKFKRESEASSPWMTFATLADQYLEVEGPRLTPRGNVLATMIVTRHLKPFLGAVRVPELRASHVEAYRAQRRQLVRRKGATEPERTDRPIAPGTFNREWSLLRAILNWGEQTDRVDRNPIKRRAVRMLPTTPRQVFLEPEEWRTFLAAAEEEDDLAASVPFWRALLLTGSRISEVTSLRWRDVELDQTRKSVRLFMGKTRRAKALPIRPALEWILRAQAKPEDRKPDELVFGGSTAYFSTCFKRILRRAPGPYAHGRPSPHAIRHTAATWLRRAGVADDRRAEVLGHRTASVRMTLDYTHADPVVIAPALDALEAFEAAALRGIPFGAEVGAEVRAASGETPRGSR